MMTAAAMAAVLAAAPVAAQEADAGTVISGSVTAGSLGIGPEVGARFSKTIGVRGSATFLGASADFDSDDTSYDGKVKLKSFGAMVDVYPFGGAFRLSGGARINSNRVTVSAERAVELDGVSYTAAEIGRLSGEAKFKKFSPALTMGYGGGYHRGLFFSAEGGVLFQGAAQLRNFRATGTKKDDATFKAALENERQSLQEDVDKVKVYPILQIGIGYRF